MEVDEIYTDFANRLVDLEVYRSVVRETTKQELARFSAS